MKLQGSLPKISHSYAERIQSYISLGGHVLHVNDLIGRTLRIEFTGQSHCKSCDGQFEGELFRMGFCKRCFFESPFAGDYIVSPEKSTAHLGQADRDLSVERDIQLKPHTVYLADSGGIKVGVTRGEEPWHRWMDQGASEGLAIARTDNRYEAGVIEVALKGHFADKTFWKPMLSGQRASQTLAEAAALAQQHVPAEMTKFWLPDGPSRVLQFDMPETMPPLTRYKLKSGEVLEAKLLGVRGQYLVFEDGRCWSTRAQEGMIVDVEIC